MEEKDRIKDWTRYTWDCGCGALNAGWLDKCGKCNTIKNEKH